MYIIYFIFLKSTQTYNLKTIIRLIWNWKRRKLDYVVLNALYVKKLIFHKKQFHKSLRLAVRKRTSSDKKMSDQQICLKQILLRSLYIVTYDSLLSIRWEIWKLCTDFPVCPICLLYDKVYFTINTKYHQKTRLFLSFRE